MSGRSRRKTEVEEEDEVAAEKRAGSGVEVAKTIHHEKVTLRASFDPLSSVKQGAR